MGIGNVGGVGRSGISHGRPVPYPLRPSNIMGGVVPGFVLDARGRNYLGKAAVPVSSLATLTNAATTRTSVLNGSIVTWAADTIRYDDSTGTRRMLFEGSRTNMLLNSAALATQSVTVTASSHVLSFWGTGSVTLSGTATGSLAGTGSGNRVSLAFTPTAGTLTLTVSGSVTSAQLETNTVATSYIPTTGTAVTIPADVVPLASGAAAVLTGGSAAVAWRGYVPMAKSGHRLLAAQSAVNLIRPYNTDPTQMMMDGPVSAATIYATGVVPAAVGTCYGWGASGGIASNNGSTAVTVGAGGTAPTAIYIGTSTGLSAGQVIYLDQLVGWTLTDRPSDALTQAQARAAL